MHTLIERPSGQRKYLRENENFISGILRSYKTRTIHKKRITGKAQLERKGLLFEGARRLRVKDQHSTFYFFPLASISFLVSLLFHPPKWEVRGCEWSVNTAKRSDKTLRVPL